MHFDETLYSELSGKDNIHLYEGLGVCRKCSTANVPRSMTLRPRLTRNLLSPEISERGSPCLVRLSLRECSEEYIYQSYLPSPICTCSLKRNQNFLSMKNWMQCATNRINMDYIRYLKSMLDMLCYVRHVWYQNKRKDNIMLNGIIKTKMGTVRYYLFYEWVRTT